MLKLSYLLAGFLISPELAGCATNVRVAFHATDASFHPSARGSEPPVYRHHDEVPRVALRSVGIIEVSAPPSEGATAAAAKGKQLGCWALVVHAEFEKLQRRSQSPERPTSRGPVDANVLVAHGGIAHIESARKPPSAMQFDCVMRQDTQPPAKTFVM